MYYIISFGENDFLDYRYKRKSNIVVMTHCLFSAKRWITPVGVYRAAMHLPKTFRDWVVIYQVNTDSDHIPRVVCCWNLSAFFTYEVQSLEV